MFDNLPKTIARAADEMTDGVMELSLQDYNNTLPKDIKPEMVVKVANHYRGYITETASSLVRVAEDMEPGTYSLYAETPFGNIEHAMTNHPGGYELTVSHHVDMSEYQKTLDKLHEKVSKMDAGSDLEDEVDDEVA